MSQPEIYDVIIIGGGPAGLSAAIYLKRALHTVMILEKSAPGGKVNYTAVVNNYPGFENVTGPDLAVHFYEHVSNMDIPLESGDVLNVEKHGDVFVITTDDDTYKAYAVIVASGTRERKMNVPGEEKFYGRGVSYCAICDGALYRGQDIAVIGGGNSAFEEAIYLAGLAKNVYLLHRNGHFKASETLIKQAQETDNLHILTDATLISINGDKIVSSITYKQAEDEKQLPISALFPFIGTIPNTQFLQNLHILNEASYVIVNSAMATTVEGLYAAGDVTEKSLRQIVTAVSDGAIAATSASIFLKRR